MQENKRIQSKYNFKCLKISQKRHQSESFMDLNNKKESKMQKIVVLSLKKWEFN